MTGPAHQASERRPLPCTEDYDTAGFFAAAQRGELVVKACADCGQVLHLPRAYCHNCGGWSTHWRVVRPSGTLYSFTTTERQVREGFPAPYTVVLVELDDAPGARLVGHLDGRPELQIGMPMRALFLDAGDDVLLPQWEPAGGVPA